MAEKMRSGDVELLVVIAIIGILSGIALPTFLSIVGKAKEVEATINMGNLSKSQKIYYM
ncbi:MAG: type II secretion system protein [Hormoscilla sp. GM7CHS1pb]|nr:type II secretion system protein [Hormoscilla sp. GM7CHS1pb]